MTGFGRAVVVGAGGGMGRMFLDRLAATDCEVSGMDLRGGEGVIEADVLDLPEAPRAGLDAADLVLLAVPDAVAARAAPGLARALAPGSMLVDCVSVKAPYARAVQGAGTCGLVSLNPLFGPGLDWTGRSVVVTELRAPRFPERLTGFLEGSGLDILRLDAEEHDRLAAEGQAQVHAAILAFLASASAGGAAFDTPPNRALRLLGARILSGEPHVYWKIQTANPFAAGARRRLIAALEALDATCAGGDEDGFARMLARARGTLGGEAREVSDQCARLFGALRRGLS